MRGFVIGFVGISMLASGAARAAVTFTKIADSSTVATGESSAFTQFHNPSLSGNNLEFLAFYSGGFGEFSATTTSGPFKVFDTGDTVPGHGAVGGFGNNGGISGGTIAFEIAYTSGYGLWHGTVGSTSITKILDTGTTNAPGQTTKISDLADVKVSGNNIAFKAYYDTGNSQGVYTETLSGTGLAKIVDFSSTAPGSTNFNQLGMPTISGNNLTFWGQSASTSGIYSGTVGTAGATKIADQTDSPLGHTHFTAFEDDPSIGGNTVAFRGIYSGGSGIYSATIGTPGFTKVAEVGDPAGDTGGNFTSVQTPSTNGSGSGVEFFAGYSSPSGNKNAIFVEADGTITRVIGAGDSLFGGVIQFVSIGNSAYDGYRVTFGYQLTNGTAGIAVADLPEPAFAGLALAGTLASLYRPRRRRISRGV